MSFKDSNSPNSLFLQEDMMPGNQHLQSPSLLYSVTYSNPRHILVAWGLVLVVASNVVHACTSVLNLHSPVLRIRGLQVLIWMVIIYFFRTHATIISRLECFSRLGVSRKPLKMLNHLRHETCFKSRITQKSWQGLWTLLLIPLPEVQYARVR